jgi:hypothetical protein
MGTAMPFKVDFAQTDHDSTPGARPCIDAAWPMVSDADGTAWCYGELLTYPDSEDAEGDTLANLRHAYADWRSGILRPERLNGRFILAIHQPGTTPETGTWTFVTDRVGAMHGYFAWRDKHIIQFGVDLADIGRTASAQALDWPAIASFFACGFFMDDQTYFTDVQALLPSSIYSVSEQGELRERRRYWAFHHTPDAKRTYDETVTVYDHLLRQAVRRASAHGRVIVPLSGGLDSRSLAAMLRRGTPAYSYGYTPDSAETWIAGQIAQARGLDFTAHVIEPYLFDRMDEIVGTLHGGQDVTQARQMSVNGWVRERADAVLTGLWGDVWCDQMGLADGLHVGGDVAGHTLKKFQKRGRAWLLDHVSGPQVRRASAEADLNAHILTGLDEFKHIDDPDFRVKAYKTTRWAFRWSNSSLRGFGGPGYGATPRVPYYDVDLIDFFCTVPTAFVRDRRLQIDHLKRFAPDLARIRWQQADANLYLARYGRWLGLPRRTARKISRGIRRSPPIQRNWEVQLARDPARLRAFLTESSMPVPVERDALNGLLHDFLTQPDAANGYTVSMLVTFAAWLKVIRG